MLLIDKFLLILNTTGQQALAKHPNPLARSGLSAIGVAAQQAEKIFFDETTMLMLTDHLAHYPETTEMIRQQIGDEDPSSLYERGRSSTRGFWLEFFKPIEAPSPIQALFTFIPAHYIKTGRDSPTLHLIDKDGAIRYKLEMLPDVGWRFDAAYQIMACPSRTCTMTSICEYCQTVLDAWVKIFGLSFIIAGQYLAAVRYEEVKRTGVRREKREKSKKERRIPTSYLFRVIDANEIIVKVPLEEESARPKEGKETWLDGTQVYEEITTRPFSRTYRSARYINCRGLVVNYPHGIKRKQPYKKETLGKHVTKVKASEYGSAQKQEKQET